MPSDPAPPIPDHTCFVCGASACWGYNTTRGDQWTCMAHRAEGERIVVPPGPWPRVAGGPRG